MSNAAPCDGRPQGGNRLSPASVALAELQSHAPADQLTLEWLINYLQKQSFGLILLLLAMVAATPGISILGAFLLLVVAIQMMMGHSAPSFPHWIGARRLPARRIAQMLHRVAPALRWLERLIHPRCTTSPEPTKRIVGLMVLMLTIRLLVVPLPFSNIVPAALIGLIALAYFEDDGAALAVGVGAGLLLIAVDLGLAKMLHDLGIVFS